MTAFRFVPKPNETWIFVGDKGRGTPRSPEDFTADEMLSFWKYGCEQLAKDVG